MPGLIRERIDSILERLKAGHTVSNMALGQLYAFLGNTKEAVRWLEKAEEQKQSAVHSHSSDVCVAAR